MSVIDATWFAEQGTAASWTHALLVQPGLEDVEAARADEDWETCLLACLLTVEKIAFCGLMLDGTTATPREMELLLALRTESSPVTDALRAIQSLRAESNGAATRAQAERARACVAEADAHVTARIPIDVLAMRTPEGFYPALRIAAELERLRSAVGLAPFEWSWWTNLS